MLINLNTAIQALQSHDGIGSTEEAIKVLEGLRVEPPSERSALKLRKLQSLAMSCLSNTEWRRFPVSVGGRTIASLLKKKLIERRHDGPLTDPYWMGLYKIRTE